MLTYYIPYFDERPEDARELKNTYFTPSNDPETFAEQAAEYCHSNRDGWEWTWPVVFVILEDGKEVGKYEVELEYIPGFYATKI